VFLDSPGKKRPKRKNRIKEGSRPEKDDFFVCVFFRGFFVAAVRHAFLYRLFFRCFFSPLGEKQARRLPCVAAFERMRPFTVFVRMLFLACSPGLDCGDGSC
jgi:hypothetical protein